MDRSGGKGTPTAVKHGVWTADNNSIKIVWNGGTAISYQYKVDRKASPATLELKNAKVAPVKLEQASSAEKQ